MPLADLKSSLVPHCVHFDISPWRHTGNGDEGQMKATGNDRRFFVKINSAVRGKRNNGRRYVEL